MFFAPKVVYPIGLDISDLSVKLVQLTKLRDKIKICAIGRIDLAPGIMENGEIMNEEALKKEIEKLISAPEYGKVESDEVIACLPESQTFIKLIEVEKKKSLEEAIKEEIERQIPFPIDDLFYDYQIIESKIDKDYVLIGAAPKTVVDKFTMLLDQLKMSVIALEIEPVSICRSLLAEEGLKNKGLASQNYCVIDIGAKHASLTAYSKKSILFSLSLPFSGDEITETIAKKINLTPEQAEKAKVICGLDKEKAEGAVKAILEKQLNRLVTRIREGIEYYQTHYPENGALNKIVLCGGGASIRELPGLIKSELDIETVLGNPFINIGHTKENSPKIYLDRQIQSWQKSQKKSGRLPMAGSELSYSTALGLALRDIIIDDI